MTRTFERAGVIGGGIMGSGIAEVCARSGLDVVPAETDSVRAEAARERIGRSLDKAVKRGKTDAAEAEAAVNRVLTTADMDALADREILVEAVAEDKSTKLDIFRRLAEIVVSEDAVLSSNTSSIPIVELATATNGRAPHVLGLHFFNPVPVLKLVEIIPSLLTAPETVEQVHAFATEQLGKDPITAPDRTGFTVNALLVPFLLSAIRMREQGIATAEDIDKGMVEGCAHPMGPLALADLIGWTLSWGSPKRYMRSTASSCSRLRRCCSGSSPPGCSGERPDVAFTATTERPCGRR